VKIAILGARGIPNVQGGIESHCAGLAPALVELGCHVTVFTRRPYVDPGLREHKGVKLVWLPALRHKYLEALPHTALGVLAARGLAPDLLHLQSIGPGFLAPLARLLGMRTVLTTHGSNYKHLKWGPIARGFLRAAEYAGVRYSNEVIAISDTIAAELLEKYGRRATVVLNGIQPPVFREPGETLRRFGLEPGRYVLSVGRFVPDKGFQDLIAGFGLAADASGVLRDERWKLVIVGAADHEDAYSRGIRDLASRDPRVVLTGTQFGEPLQEILSNAGIFAMMSYYEGLAIALLEALGYGLSCLATDVPGNRGVQLEEGRYVPTGDAAALAAALKHFAAHPASDDERRRRSRETLERYDWKVAAASTLAVYRRAVSR